MVLYVLALVLCRGVEASLRAAGTVLSVTEALVRIPILPAPSSPAVVSLPVARSDTAHGLQLGPDAQQGESQLSFSHNFHSSFSPSSPCAHSGSTLCRTTNVQGTLPYICTIVWNLPCVQACDGGLAEGAYAYLTAGKGTPLALLDDYPYRGQDSFCRDNATAVQERGVRLKVAAALPSPFCAHIRSGLLPENLLDKQKVASRNVCAQC